MTVTADQAAGLSAALSRVGLVVPAEAIRLWPFAEYRAAAAAEWLRKKPVVGGPGPPPACIAKDAP